MVRHLPPNNPLKLSHQVMPFPTCLNKRPLSCHMLLGPAALHGQRDRDSLPHRSETGCRRPRFSQLDGANRDAHADAGDATTIIEYTILIGSESSLNTRYAAEIVAGTCFA